MKPENRSEDSEMTVPRRLRIGEAIVCEQSRSISIAGQTHALTDLSWRFLSALIRAAPDPVSYEVLSQAVWGRGFVSDETIAQRARQLRLAFADDSKVPAYVRTIRGGGYQLIPAVELLAQQSEPKALFQRPAKWWAAAGLAVVVASGIAYWILAAADKEPDRDLPVAAPAVSELLTRAHDYIARGQYQANEHAISLYQQILEIEPKHVAGLVGLSFALSNKPSKYEESLRWADQAAKLADEALVFDPERSGAWAARGLADDARGRVSHAIEYYRRAAILNPADTGLLSSIAYLLQVQGKLHASLELEADALQKAPPSHFADFQIAVSLDLAGLDAAAGKWLHRAELLRPDNVFLVEYRATRLIGRHQYKSALALLDDSDKHRAGHHAVRGIAHLALGQNKESRLAFRESQRRAREKGRDCLVCAAGLLLAGGEGELETAQDILQSALTDLHPGDEWPYHRVKLAFLYAALGNNDSALDFLEQAFSLGYMDQFWLRETPMLTSLHQEERFVDLLSHMNRHATEQRKLIEGDSSLTFLLEN